MKYPNGNGYNLTDGGDNYDCGLTTNYRDTTLAKKAQQKPVTATSISGEYFYFDTVRETITFTKIHHATVINLLKTGKSQRGGGWKFKYTTNQHYNSDGSLNYFGTIFFGKKSAKKPKHQYHITLKDGSLHTFNTLVEASRVLGVAKSAFHSRIKRRKMNIPFRSSGILKTVEKLYCNTLQPCRICGIKNFCVRVSTIPLINELAFQCILDRPCVAQTHHAS